ncbi:MAG: PAS domain S-box protein [Candidatus Synoicihabitans palmerolidicus]|nr:PAS domain S-box protein [Candidatus Synoicihabitans palmerolidicus]
MLTRLVLPPSGRTIFTPDAQIPPLAYNENSLIAHFLAPSADFQPTPFFEARLSPNARWEPQGSSGSAVYNNLPEGDYELQIRARSGDAIATLDSVRFSIATPWVRSNLAYLAYGVGALGLIGLVIWTSTLLERRENTRLEGLVKQHTLELRQTNDQLEEQVQEIRILSQAINQSPVSVLITQHDGTILYANPRVCELTGYLEAELIGRQALDLRNLTDHSVKKEAITASLMRGESWTGEILNRHADGRIVHVRSTLSPVNNPEQSGHLYLILDEDITSWRAEQERHRLLEDQLFQARKLESIGTRAGGIAHDFNNILTGILGHIEVALLDVDPSNPLADDLKDIRRNGLRTKYLVYQILTFSRKADSKLVPIDISEPVREAFKLVRASTPSLVEITQDITSGTVLADATQIHQIVRNLCTNAAHALEGRRGRISVELRFLQVEASLSNQISGLNPGPHMALPVSDDGSGMDNDTLARIYDPFFTTKEQGKGTGLGLSIGKGILASHRGAQRVRSSHDVGTTFELYFPCSRDALPIEVPSIEDIPRGDSLRILIVDDEPTVVEFVSTRLKHFGYNPIYMPQSNTECTG